MRMSIQSLVLRGHTWESADSPHRGQPNLMVIGQCTPPRDPQVPTHACTAICTACQELSGGPETKMVS